MQTIVIASQKGGVGKTTLTGHLAVEAERQGISPVAVIDTDPQAGLSGWFRVREPETPVLVRILPEGLAATLQRLEQSGVQLCIIDTPPAITESIAATVALADLVVIPAKPSPHDLRAVGATVDLVEQAGRPMVFVINQAISRSKLKTDAIRALSQHGTLAPVEIHNRVDFAASMTDGRTAGELDPHSASGAEIAQLWTYIADRLARRKRYGLAARAS
ncbi:ParA family protein [Roseomonas sp. 18066]|uniref:ParA family protein n=1 Tax=Roseomonas sp. 18066 TaxID=2681412 RepID=UPI00135C9290|nr:ParA family protein [Roseomonas sp. 18066]